MPDGSFWNLRLSERLRTAPHPASRKKIIIDKEYLLTPLYSGAIYYWDNPREGSGPMVGPAALDI